ncbi:MAG: chemotaxis protein CheW [Candidatus Rokubacteria bacterium]|nr:chemotaxis protein CheW [Candidatus Rokubacteria bacterium]
MNDLASHEDRSLLCRAATILCALPLPRVVETMRPLPIRPLGGMPSFVCGLSVIRGVAIPVVNAAALLGLPTHEQATRLVTLRTGERLVALAVEEVVGVRTLSSVSLQTLPPLLHRVKPKVITLIGMLDANLLVVLQDSRIVPDWIWRSLAGNGDTLCPLA